MSFKQHDFPRPNFMASSSAMTSYDLALVPGRQCGDCTVCCTAMAIDKPEIQKEAGATCRHCARGCTIYETRPSICRDYHCGWRQLPILDDSWRPDRSQVFVEVEALQGMTGLSLVLIGNPLKTLRQPWFVDFVTIGVKGGVPLSLGILGPRGHQGASLLLNTQDMLAAASQSRAQVKALLEKELKRLAAYDFPLRVICHQGNNVGEPSS
ncbi:MAG: YkgJ family cysteine cluster protein [Rhizomicrobium sp.]